MDGHEMMLSHDRRTLLTGSYSIKVTEFAYGKKRWAIIAVSMMDERAPIIRLGEYDNEEQAVAAFDAVIYQLKDKLIYV